MDERTAPETMKCKIMVGTIYRHGADTDDDEKIKQSHTNPLYFPAAARESDIDTAKYWIIDLGDSIIIGAADAEDEWEGWIGPDYREAFRAAVESAEPYERATSAEDFTYIDEVFGEWDKGL